jgi:macrolide transport system ATP-binding/permease protein
MTAITVLALGIGAATAIFAFVDATLIEPLPHREPGQLMALYERNPMGDRFNLSDFDYRVWEQRNHVFTSLDVYEPYRYLLNTPRGPEKVSAAIVSDGLFRTLGVTPALGRDFCPGEDRPTSPRTTILSYATWKYRFGGSEKVLGQAVELDGESYTIVGVLPREFHLLRRDASSSGQPCTESANSTAHAFPFMAWRGCEMRFLGSGLSGYECDCAPDCS